MQPKLSLILMLGILIETCSAKNLGTYGPVFEIKEESLLKLIEKRLQTLKESGKLESHQQELARKAEEKVKRPTPVSGISIAQVYKKKEYDPSFVVSQDIKDHLGNLIAK
jgi:conjugal transfer pilus assembly protein TraW